jgi:hypothetical protein
MAGPESGLCFPLRLEELERWFPLDLPQKSFLRLFLLALGVRLLFLAIYMVAYPAQ